MALTPGTRLGPYEVVGSSVPAAWARCIGRRDTKLIARSRSRSCPRRSRPIPSAWRAFQREAQVLASLNHPHIAAIYGLEGCGGLTRS